MANEEFVVLRLLHIVSGAYWVGASVFLAFILEPTLTEMGPSVKGPVMMRLSKRIAISIFTAAVITVVMGVVLSLRLKSGALDTWFDTGWGYAILLGFIASILAVITGSMTGQTVQQMSKMTARAQARSKDDDGPPPREVLARMQALGKRLTNLSRSTAVLTVIGVGTMASARFV